MVPVPWCVDYSTTEFCGPMLQLHKPLIVEKGGNAALLRSHTQQR